MSSSFVNLPRRRWSADEVVRLAELGVFDGEHVELLHGELVVVSPQGAEHAGLIGRITALLVLRYHPRWHVRVQTPIRAAADSLPEPDFAVVRGEPDLTQLPDGGDVCLALEVSVTTQRYDREKAAVYAAAGVANYWLVNTAARRIEVFAEPTPDGIWRINRLAAPGEALELPAGGGEVAVADLLP